VRELFGTDGVRGIANKDLTVHLSLRLARAAVAVLRRDETSRLRVVMGRDTRLSGDMIEAAMCAGFFSAGADVVDVGVIPTPGIAYLARKMDVDMGVVISASHNPFAFNGIKFFSHEGYKLPDDTELAIEHAVKSTENLPHPVGDDLGRRLPAEGAMGRYLDYLRALVPDGLAGMKLVLDCANGAAAGIAPGLFRELGAEVIPLNDEPDGININAGCGATHPEVVARAVLAHGAHAGLSFDGDADRLLLADETGRVVDGDRIMAMTAVDLHGQGRLPGGVVVGTVMSNLGLERGLERLGFSLLRTKVGDRYVLEEMQARGATLGGEQSGHIIFLDHATTGDGLVTALMVLKLLRASGQPLSTLANVIDVYPQKLVNITVPEVKGWDAHSVIRRAIADAETDLGATGRVLVRASGTEPKIRVMVEALEQAKVDHWTTFLADVISTQLT
jgi:phosphoglucosamine mutase